MKINKKELPDCSVETTLMLISNKWKILIIRDLFDGTKRFSELKKSINNISQKVLTSNLREMEKNGLLTRKIYPEVPPRVEYTLTKIGKSLSPILEEMDKAKTYRTDETEFELKKINGKWEITEEN